MTTFYYDLEAKRADHWLITREEVIAWLDAIFDAPFGPLTLGRFANRTDEAQQAREVANRIFENAPAISPATDPAAWARNVLHVAAMVGDLNECAGGSPLVLRFVVAHVKSHARITVADLKGLKEEREQDALAAAAAAAGKTKCRKGRAR